LHSYLTVCRPELISQRILELGSGVGAVGCYVAALQAQEQQGSITLTDYDHQLLANMCHAVQRTFPHGSTHPTHDDTSPFVRIAQLDWMQFAQSATTPHSLEYDDIDCVIGSALVYGPQHACVADVLKVECRQPCRWIDAQNS
jgi:hypothetical protein